PAPAPPATAPCPEHPPPAQTQEPEQPNGVLLDIAEIVRQLLEEGWEIDPEDLAQVSPYLTEHIKRFGEYSTHELGIEPEAYDPKLDVDFAPLREQDGAPQDLTTVGFGQAA
ncbi:Tn3 family transposase, partial [Streptomyces sp. NPDC059467]|uniref:Tn3 family transposase n=1 Tax=Streptomyces sp. NPDC059467 TaxID=3346844 RepID=UPI0036903D0E